MEYSPVIETDYPGLRTLVDQFAENADVFERLDYLWDDLARGKHHFLVLQNNRKIVAAGSVCPNPRDPGMLWLAHISVDAQHKAQGHGTHIANSIFNYAARGGYVLSTGSFRPEGLQYLAPVMARIHSQYPQLKVQYETLTGEIIDGTRPYTLSGARNRSIVQINY